MRGNHFEFVLTVRRAIWGMAACICLAFGLVTSAVAAPVTYTAFTISNGRLGNWSFTNGRVYLTLETDTSYVVQQQIFGVNVAYVGPYPPQQICTGPTTSIGTARVTIVSGGRTVTATFGYDQLFVSLDQDNGGVGFGSCGPGQTFQPAYPLGVEDGTIDYLDNTAPSPEWLGLPVDLMHSTDFSGRAWICTDFPFPKSCPTPAQGLHTDKGDFYLYQTYQISGGGNATQAGFFVANVGGGRHQFSTSTGGGFGYKPITYNGFTVTDVTLGGQTYYGAQVHLSLQSDASRVVPFPDNTGYQNSVGLAQLEIVSAGHVISRLLAPHQLYVYFDHKNASVGFGSYAGGRGYPLSLTAHEDNNGLVEHSSVGAVVDILNTGDTTNYTPATSQLKTDLTGLTVLSAGASSCVAFDPTTSICNNLTPVPLWTTWGESVYINEPYTDDQSGNGTAPYTVNWGLFWSTLGGGDN